MLTLNGTNLSSLPIVNLEWVHDLENFDGPLLSLFKHKRRGDKYLYYWCDCDKEVNRWMIFRVSETSIIRLVNRLIPLDQVIPNGCQDDFVYFTDMDGKSNPKKVVLVNLDAIPEQYTPLEGAFLSSGVVERLGSYSVVIERDLSIAHWTDFFKEFSNAYAFIYNIIKLRSQRIKAHPWRGGWSSMHFWRELLEFIPDEDYPSLDTLQYASPGFIRFKLDSSVASRVGKLASKYRRDGGDIIGALGDLLAYFRIHKLNDEISPADSIWNLHNEKITELTTKLLDAMEIPQIREFLSASSRPFEAAKMTAAFARRIRKLSILEEDRLILFPNLEPDAPK